MRKTDSPIDGMKAVAFIISLASVTRSVDAPMLLQRLVDHCSAGAMWVWPKARR